MPVSSLIDQVFAPNLQEFLQVVLPVEGDPVRIYAVCEFVVHVLVRQDVEHLLHVELLGIKFRQRRCKFDPQFWRIEHLSIGHDKVDSMAKLSGKVAGVWGEARRHKSYAWNLPAV